MILLTPIQEKKILHSLENVAPFDKGASRVCFECPFEVIEYLNLNKKYQYLIKVSIGLGGLSQTQLEVSTYQEYGDEYPLAQIFAAGRYIEIMEELEVDYDFRDFVGDGCCFCEEDDMGEEYWGFSENIGSQVEVVANLLSELFGHTSDNGQIGYSFISQRYVTYDYGYTTDKYTEDQVSDLAHYLCDQEELKNYLVELEKILEQENELLGSIEKAILRRVDKFYEEDEEEESEDEADTCESLLGDAKTIADKVDIGIVNHEICKNSSDSEEK